MFKASSGACFFVTETGPSLNLVKKQFLGPEASNAVSTSCRQVDITLPQFPSAGEWLTEHRSDGDLMHNAELWHGHCAFIGLLSLDGPD